MKIISVGLILALAVSVSSGGCQNSAEATQNISNGVPAVPTATPPETATISEPPPLPPSSAEPKKTPLEYANEQDKLLFQAIENGDAATAGQLLERGANANANVKIFNCAEGEPAYTTPLGEAVAGKKVEIAKLLLERGADVNKHFFCGTSVHLNFPKAVSNQDLEMMKLLVEHSAETQKSREDYEIISKAKSREILDYLVSLGFDINARDDYHGFTALFLAVRSRDLDLVKAVLRHKPDLSIRTEPTKVNAYKELTALQWAEAADDKAIVRELKKAAAKK